MSGRSIAVIVGLVALGAGAALWLARAGAGADVPVAPTVRAIEVPPVCPWRDPRADLARFFPGATAYHQERRILSGRVLTLTQRLGRPVQPGETVLDLYQVHGADGTLSRILLRRVRGEYGAVELVLALGRGGEVRGLHIQRDREPGPIERALHSADWLARFQGRTAADVPLPEQMLAGLPPEARPTATAIAEGVRTLLILDDEAIRGGAPVHRHEESGGA